MVLAGTVVEVVVEGTVLPGGGLVFLWAGVVVVVVGAAPLQ